MDNWKEYQKINTLYKRDMNGNKQIVIGEFSDPNVELLKDIKWEATEKIDGTNICVSWDGYNVIFHGRTNNADIPKHLLNRLHELFPKELLENVFPLKVDENNNEIPMQIDLFGEGYGMKIQKGDNYIKDNTSFILFDVRIDNWWLLRESIEDIAQQLNIKTVPVMGYYTIQEAESMVIEGFKSTIADNKEYDAEGLVLKTSTGLCDRRGKRILVKIKTIDYRKLGMTKKIKQ